MTTVTLQIEADPDAVASAAAQLVAEGLEAAERTFTWALSGGSTPRRLYERLAAQPELPWTKVRLFLGDERALPGAHPDRNSTMVQATLIEPLGLTPAQVFLPDGGAQNLDAAAEAYSRLLLAEAGDPPALDLALLGMGGDGHTASLFPGEPIPAGWVASVRAPADTASQSRLTLTLATFLSARQAVVLVTGSDKAARLAEVFEGRDPGPLAQILTARTLPTRLIVDRAAAGGLGRTTKDG